eukprot:gnl/MRDRNA2_/MRDRNA2_82071_c0_seq2.p1 gnl/MRDRNA2_/MRDRNA2_82071_c0~~gnl/MRDRNA2_/MRDRNA2_82071_c0_seq2.p1  ORF type:complete len:285 (+),score=47.36 gnl/MRDRNA2_/MRDRNA2_82071_c0_seq2:315-1169(+)
MKSVGAVNEHGVMDTQKVQNFKDVGDPNSGTTGQAEIKNLTTADESRPVVAVGMSISAFGSFSVVDHGSLTMASNSSQVRIYKPEQPAVTNKSFCCHSKDSCGDYPLTYDMATGLDGSLTWNYWLLMAGKKSTFKDYPECNVTRSKPDRNKFMAELVFSTRGEEVTWIGVYNVVARPKSDSRIRILSLNVFQQKPEVREQVAAQAIKGDDGAPIEIKKSKSVALAKVYPFSDRNFYLQMQSGTLKFYAKSSRNGWSCCHPATFSCIPTQMGKLCNSDHQAAGAA